MTQDLIMLLLAPVQSVEEEPSTSLERIITVLAPIALGILALFNKNVRAKITGSNEPAPRSEPGHAPTPVEAATKAFTASVDFQHTLIVELQQRAERGEAKVLVLEGKLDATEDELAKAQVKVARLEGQVGSLQAEVDRLQSGGAGWRR